MPIYISEGMGF